MSFLYKCTPTKLSHLPLFSSPLTKRLILSLQRWVSYLRSVKSSATVSSTPSFLSSSSASSPRRASPVWSTATTPVRTEIVIRCTKTREVIGDNARRIRELTACIEQRFHYKPGKLQLFTDRVEKRGLSAMAQVESLRFKLLSNLQVRRAAMGIIRYVMESGAKGCEVTVGGKIKGQRAKSMTFRDGYMIKSGTAHKTFVDSAARHCYLRAGVIGCKVKIMLPSSAAEGGPGQELPDVITVIEPKTVEAQA
ncbi:small subunit ribosomal protein S3e [Angomonas deanei]|nr:small subunit ribosomal protein S3e [Angomonas deanei]|eukprot:EPY24483.1 small subunit ribosomal protein S3e [Angomonas deanei]